eukprot:6326727-Ditylum_brightwellii.AAC.1
MKGQVIQDSKATYTLVKSLLMGYTLQVFQNKEANQKERDNSAFTKCFGAVTEHIFPKKAYKTQKKYIQNNHEPLRFGSHKWILHMIKLNDYLVIFPVPEGVTATKLSHKEFADVLEDGVPLQWKLEFKNEGFNSNVVMLKECLNMRVHLEEEKMQKLLACAKKDHDKASRDGTGKCHGKSELHHKRFHRPGKLHAGKCKKKSCNYHGLCHHDTKACNYYQACRKHNAKRCVKKHSLSTKEVKDLNTFVKGKTNETIKQYNHNMHAMRDLKDLSISSRDKSI